MKQLDEATAQAARAAIDHHHSEQASPCCMRTLAEEVCDALSEAFRQLRAWFSN